jgi:hypothetical protein
LVAVAAFFALQAVADFGEEEIVAEIRSQFHEAQASVVSALSAMGAVVICVVHVSEGIGFESGVFHGDNDSAGGLWIAAV